MENYHETESNRFSRQEWNERQRSTLPYGSQHDSSDYEKMPYEKKPYGERYGEDTNYPGGYDYDRSERYNRQSSFSPYAGPSGSRYDFPGHSSGLGDYRQSELGSSGYGGLSGYGSGYSNERENSISGRNGDRDWWDRASDELGDENAERRRREDEHRGKGPKNYKRSDVRIKDEVNDRLTDDWSIDATGIEVTVSNGEVTLTGTVSGRSQKRRAEDLVENISGVTLVENRLRVAPVVTT